MYAVLCLICLGAEIEVGVYDKNPTDFFIYANGLDEKDEYGWPLTHLANIRLQATFDWDTPQLWYDSVIVSLPATELSHLLQITVEPGITKDFNVRLLLDTVEITGNPAGPCAMMPTTGGSYDVALPSPGMFFGTSATLQGGWDITGPTENKTGLFSLALPYVNGVFPNYTEAATADYPNVCLTGYATSTWQAPVAEFFVDEVMDDCAIQVGLNRVRTVLRHPTLAIPEPGTWALALVGLTALCGLGLWRRMRRNR